jgi:hypothetical protein
VTEKQEQLILIVFVIVNGNEKENIKNTIKLIKSDKSLKIEN